ncbi:MAG TPA: hypothetical protein VIM42_01425 [Clostridium sp.]
MSKYYYLKYYDKTVAEIDIDNKYGNHEFEHFLNVIEWVLK